MTFEEFSLAPVVFQGIKAAGFTEPTPIQQQAIPPAMKGRDVLGLAETGTGKTAAFLLPILDKLVRSPRPRGVRVLVLEPTRELAEQVHQATVVLGRNTGVRSTAIYGGVSKIPQFADLRRGVEIVVACPGRLLDHVEQGALDLSKIEFLALDEADTMLDMGFLPDVRRILAHLPVKRQSLLFSATMPEEIRKLAMRALNDPEIVQVGRIGPARTVSHALYPVPDNRKKLLLAALLNQTPTGRALVFTRTKFRARNLARDLANLNFRVSALQGNLSQSRRQQAMDGFRSGKFDILVATDIAAHGIDVPEVSHVINFDMPDTVDAYIHRIGRTGRALQDGEAFTLATMADASMVRQVEMALDAPVEKRSLPGFEYGDFSPEAQFPIQPRSGPNRRPPAASGKQSRSGPGGRPPVASGRQPRSGPGGRPPTASGRQPRSGPGGRPPTASGRQPRSGPSGSSPAAYGRQPRFGQDGQPKSGLDNQPQRRSPVQPRTGPSLPSRPGASRPRPSDQSNGGAAKRHARALGRVSRKSGSPPSRQRPPGRR